MADDPALAPGIEQMQGAEVISSHRRVLAYVLHV
jgi:hypothetical protein